MGVLIIYSARKWCIIYNHLLVDAVLKMNCRGWKGRTGNSRGSQPGFLERIFSNPPPPPPPPPPLPAPPPSQQLWDREGLSSCTPRGEREDGNAKEVGVVLHGMKSTALHHINREYDTQPTRLQSIFSICHSRTPVLMLWCGWSQIKEGFDLLKLL